MSICIKAFRFTAFLVNRAVPSTTLFSKERLICNRPFRPASVERAKFIRKKHGITGRSMSFSTYPNRANSERRAIQQFASKLNDDPELTKKFVQCLSHDSKLRIANQILDQKVNGVEYFNHIAGRHRRAITVREVSMNLHGAGLGDKIPKVDTDNDGIVSDTELTKWLENLSSIGQIGPKYAPENLTRKQLVQLFLVSGIPFVGFGFLDNAIMIVAGDVIDNSIGVFLGISTLAAAGLGNLISDVAGIGAGGFIEASSKRLGLQDPNLSLKQLASRKVKLVQLLATTVGIIIGCVLGMFPLLFIDTDDRQIHEVFSLLDADSSGSIDKQEMIKLVNSSRELLGEKEANVIVEVLKKHDQDYFDFEAFTSFMHEVQQKKIEAKEQVKFIKFLSDTFAR